MLFGFSLLFACNENPKPASEDLSEAEKQAYIKKGKSIAMATFSTLSAELGKALEEGGVSQAVEVCNIAAMPLVDSLSKAHNATIRRTSLKVRNPKNTPSADELKILNDYAKNAETRDKIELQIIEVDGMVSFYAPIMTKPLCLKCHGKIGETLNEEDYEVIKKLYPDDQAIGYDNENLRGIWSIQFEK